MKKILMMLAILPVSYSVMAIEPIDNTKYCYYANEKSVPGTVIVYNAIDNEDGKKLVQVCAMVKGHTVWLNVDEKSSVQIEEDAYRKL